VIRASARSRIFAASCASSCFRIIASSSGEFPALARGRGVEAPATGASLWTISGGVTRSLKLFQSKGEALEAAGLRE
jgi:hypothetical protein